MRTDTRTNIEKALSHVESELDRIARTRSRGMTYATVAPTLDSAQLTLSIVAELLEADVSR